MAKKETNQGNDGLEGMKVNEIKALLKAKGLPVSGKKADLINRLRNPPPVAGPKPKPWQHSSAKKDLKKSLMDPSSSIHNMSLSAIRDSDPRFKQYPKFEKYFKDLKAKVEEEKRMVKEDDRLAEEHVKNFPGNQRNPRGYPRWKDHPAKALLEIDVASKLHKRMQPAELWATRKEYEEFPLKVFRKYKEREVEKQRAALHWADKRNKEGLKKYLKHLEKKRGSSM